MINLLMMIISAIANIKSRGSLLYQYSHKMLRKRLLALISKIKLIFKKEKEGESINPDVSILAEDEEEDDDEERAP